MKWALTALVLLLVALHQDVWLWNDRTLVFGVLPIGLAYHASYSLAAAVVMAILVRFAWPHELDEGRLPGEDRP